MERNTNISASMRIKQIVSFFLIWINIIPIIVYFFAKKEIDEDISRILKYIPFTKSNVFSLNYALIFLHPFRSVFKYRLSQRGILFRVIGIFFIRTLKSIELSGKIGGGYADLSQYGVCGCSTFCR